MTWRYVLRAESPTPPCPYCGSRSGVVLLRDDVYCCLDCTPRRAFEAVWVDDRQVEQPERRMVG